MFHPNKHKYFMFVFRQEAMATIPPPPKKIEMYIDCCSPPKFGAMTFRDLLGIKNFRRSTPSVPWDKMMVNIYSFTRSCNQSKWRKVVVPMVIGSAYPKKKGTFTANCGLTSFYWTQEQRKNRFSLLWQMFGSLPTTIKFGSFKQFFFLGMVWLLSVGRGEYMVTLHV